MKIRQKLIAGWLVVGLLFIVGFATAQNEQKGFSFQGYARDFNGAAYSSAQITAKFTIYPEGESEVYSEEHSLTTDAYGVFQAVVGSQTPVDFAAIDYTNKKYFMKSEVKVTGGDFVTLSDTELLAVPYAKAAQRSSNGNPAGTILPFGGPNVPSGYLPCDGRSVLVSDYPELHAAIGDAWGGDGGTNFNLPNLQGQFLRGWDNGEGVDSEAGSRTASNVGGNTGDLVGTLQGDEVKGHDHTASSSEDGLHTHGADTYRVSGGNANEGRIGGNSDHTNHRVAQNIHNAGLHTHTITVDASNGVESRPVNAAVLFMIKY